MPFQTRATAHLIDAFSPLRVGERLALFAFIASLPVWVPVLNQAGWNPASDQPAQGGSFAQVFSPMALSAIGCALALLFVCLLKTAHAHLDRRLVRVMGAAYVAGLVLYALMAGGLVPAAGTGAAPEVVCGVLAGSGSVILLARWALRLRWSSARAALAGVAAVFAVALAVQAVLGTLAEPAAPWVLAALGAVGTIGSLISFARAERTAPGAAPADSQPRTEEANWWDIFGRLDTSVLLQGEEFSAPRSRILFFIVVPVLMGLLWAVSSTTAVGGNDGAGTLLGAAAAVACAIPLVHVRSDRALLNIGFRMVLPLVALIMLACGTFVPEPARMQAASVGITVYCVLYSLLMGGLIFSMPGRMRSLALPCASVVSIVVNLMVLITCTPFESGGTTPAQPLIAGVSVVGSAWLLLAILGGRMWAQMMDLIPLESAQADQRGETPAVCSERMAREYGLTERESQVLPLLTRGHGAAYIAARLGISESTVRTHRTNIYRKLGVTCREELIAFVDRSAGNEGGQASR